MARMPTRSTEPWRGHLLIQRTAKGPIAITLHDRRDRAVADAGFCPQLIENGPCDGADPYPGLGACVEMPGQVRVFQHQPIGPGQIVAMDKRPAHVFRAPKGDPASVARLADKIAKNAHAISNDGKFSWEEVECLGACANAPMGRGREWDGETRGEGGGGEGGKESFPSVLRLSNLTRVVLSGACCRRSSVPLD